MAVATLMAFESRKLLLGDAADPAIVSSVEKIVSEDKDIIEVLKPMTMHMGPNEVLLDMGLNFRKGLSTSNITKAIDRVEKQVQDQHPQVKHIFLEAEALRKIEE